jgi:two-component system, LytTR family, response regulator
MKALLIDDERLARNGLRRLLKAHADVEIAGEAANADEGLRAIRELNPDLIFLDVEMPGCNGFELLERAEDVSITIFTTAYDAYAVRAFEASALDYLVKPISPERLDSSLTRARRAFATLTRPPTSLPRSEFALQQIFVRACDRCWIVRLADILLLESEGNYTRLYFGTERPLIFRSLAAIEGRLNSNVFFRANRSQIVNLRWIEHVENEIDGHLVLKLAKGIQVGISRRQSKRLKQLLSL